MPFRDLDEFFDPTLDLPIRGTTYSIGSPDAKTGLYCQRLIATAQKAQAGQLSDDEAAAQLELDDDAEKSLYERLLGDAHQQMVDDGVAWEDLKHAGTTALIWAAGNVDAAEAFWNAGGQGKAPNRAARRASAKSAPQASSGTSHSPQVVQGQVTASKTSSPGGTSSKRTSKRSTASTSTTRS